MKDFNQPMKISLFLGSIFAILCLVISGKAYKNSAGDLKIHENSLQIPEAATPYPFPLDFFDPQILSKSDLTIELMPNTQYNDAILTIFRGNNWYQEILVSSITGLKNTPRPFASAKVIDLIDLDQNGELEIIFLTTHQGAGGSMLTYVIYFDKTVEAYFTTPGFVDLITLYSDPLDYFARPVFVSFDYSFFSTMIPTSLRYCRPVQLLEFDGRDLIDVTINYPEIVVDDAEYWSAYVENRRPNLSQLYINLRGINLENWDEKPEFCTNRILLAAYLANMYRLNKEIEGWEKLRMLCDEPDNCELFHFFLAHALIKSDYTDIWPEGVPNTLELNLQ